MSVAYHAAVTMHEAKWTDKEGSTVTLRLPMHGMEGQRNPFEKWTKRRKGRAGTRFMMACSTAQVGEDSKQIAVYEDEAMLAGWNDSQTYGHTVKFWLCADAMGHPFEGFERGVSKFYISLVELDDDNEVIDQKMREKVEKTGKRPSERASYVAAMLCKNEGFWTYVTDIDDLHMEAYDCDQEEGARAWLCNMLGITSRAELDKSEVLAQRFHDEIRRPFLQWQGEY